MSYDLIVIGGGSGGYVPAERFPVDLCMALENFDLVLSA